MKNNIIIGILLCTVCLTSCQQDIQETGNYIGKHISVSAQAGENTSTRTTLNGFQTQWVAGDQIGVFSPQSDDSNYPHTATTDAAVSPFNGTMVWSKDPHDFYAYYPYVDGAFTYTAVPVSLPAVQTQTAANSSEHIAALDFMVASPLTGIEVGGEVSFQFSHLFTLLEFRVVGAGKISRIELAADESAKLAFSDGTVDISQDKPSDEVPYAISYLNSTSSSVALELMVPTTLTDNDETTPILYMMVNPTDLTGKEITVTATIDGEPKTITAHGFNIVVGRKYTLIVDPAKGIADPENVLTLIPDHIFRAYCESMMGEWDINQDGKLSPEEAVAVKVIEIIGEWVFNTNGEFAGRGNLKSLKGIEYFTGLIKLACWGQQLTSLDVSKNTALQDLDCFFNYLTSLDISNNTDLLWFNCNNNQLTELDVSKNINLRSLWFPDNQLTEIDISNNLKLIDLGCTNNQLTSLDLSRHTALGHLTCGMNQLSTLDLSSNTCLVDLWCYNNQLTSLNLSNNTMLVNLLCDNNQLTTLDLSNNTALKEIACSYNKLISLHVSNNNKLTYFSCSNNQLASLDISRCIRLTNFYINDNPGDGKIFPITAWFNNDDIPTDFPTSWNYNGSTITVNYTKSDVPLNDFYTSTDYSADGKVTTLQKATQGNGIDIVLMGDAYSDRLIADGTYEQTMRKAMDFFFTEEPYKSHRDMFNVYAVNVVSKNEVYDAYSMTALNGYFGGGPLVGGSDAKCIAYAQKAITADRLDDALIVVMMNSESYGGTCYMYYPTNGDYGRGLSIAYFPIGTNDGDFESLLHHEAGGHGFAKLADEYAYEFMGGIPASEITSTKQMEPYGWWRNVDFTNNPEQVKWAKYLTDNRYAQEGLGIYEGALTYWAGAYRPTDYSIMRYNTGGFNAPSREAIYYRIHKLAYGSGWTYNYEAFVSYDAINRTFAANAARARQAVARTRPFKPQTPPVVIPHSWREAK